MIYIKQEDTALWVTVTPKLETLTDPSGLLQSPLTYQRLAEVLALSE